MLNQAKAIPTRSRIIITAATLAIAVSGFVGIRYAAAEPVGWTGPTGAQCNIKQQGGDFVGPDNSDTTNNANISLSPTTGNPDGQGPFMTPAGCELAPPVNPPPPPPPTPVPPKGGTTHVGVTSTSVRTLR
jgi:hypothetical protein